MCPVESHQQIVRLSEHVVMGAVVSEFTLQLSICRSFIGYLVQITSFITRRPNQLVEGVGTFPKVA